MKKRGFTLVELLVVIAIIGILIGMLLPAVQAVREAARRINCGNNMHQIALALHNHESANMSFPHGWTAGRANSPADPGYGWMAYTLPFVEQANIVLDLSVSTVDLPVEGVRTQTFDLMLCPSSSADTPTYRLPTNEDGDPARFPFDIARSHYVGSIGSNVDSRDMKNGDTLPDEDLLLIEENVTGVFAKNSKTTFGEVSDGTSNTILVGERSGLLSQDGYTGSEVQTFFDSSWLGVVKGSAYSGWRVVAWTGEPPKNKPTSEVHFHGYAQFNSDHPGTTTFALCDGSTQSITDDIDHEVFSSLGTINGGEVIGSY